MAGPNNAIYFNAAYAGFLGGATSERYLTDSTGSHYNGIVAAANAFATEVDAAIPLDGSADVARANLLQEICDGVMQGRWDLDATAADYSVSAAAIAALFNNAKANLL